jgi:hypothetical protein
MDKLVKKLMSNPDTYTIYNRDVQIHETFGGQQVQHNVQFWWTRLLFARPKVFVLKTKGFDFNFLTNLSIRASANLFYLPETVNY